MLLEYSHAATAYPSSTSGVAMTATAAVEAVAATSAAFALSNDVQSSARIRVSCSFKLGRYVSARERRRGGGGIAIGSAWLSLATPEGSLLPVFRKIYKLLLLAWDIGVAA